MNALELKNRLSIPHGATITPYNQVVIYFCGIVCGNYKAYL